jgi:signal transduction histidine kinase
MIMSSSARERSRITSTLEEIGTRSHLCLIYETPEEQFSAIAPFVRFGLERGERNVYIADENPASKVLESLRLRGIDVDAAIGAGALATATKRETYLRRGRFDPDGMIRFLGEAIDSAKAAGFSALRITGEMTWALGGEPGVERLMEYEAKLNRFFSENDGLAICQYNRKRFPPELMKDVIHTHPLVVFGGLVCKNSNYIPPDEFLTPAAASIEVDRLLESMFERGCADQELREREADLRDSERQLQSLAGKLLSVHEEELRHLAREIHGDVSQRVATLAMKIEQLAASLEAAQEPLREGLVEIEQQVAGLSESIHAISRRVHPSILGDLGLAEALGLECEKFSHAESVTARYETRDVPEEVPEEVALCLYRIAQECLRNTARHAQTNEVHVSLTGVDDGVRLMVRDAGIGFDTAANREGSGLGLLGMAERARLIQAKLSIESEPGRGTVVTIRAPLSEGGRSS